MHKIDLKDKKILYQLDLNCRQSFQKIGKKVRLSKESVFYRIKKLEEQGIIESYSTLLDIGKLGYTSFRIFLKFQNTTSSKEEEIINYLKKEKIVGWFVTIEGNWNVNLWLMSKNVEDFDSFWIKFKEKYINYIAKQKLAVFTNITYFSKSYLINKFNKDKCRFVSPPKQGKIDKINLEILKLLASNARLPTVDIAQKLKISAKTVAHRIKDLEKKKIIVGFKPLLNLNKLGYSYYKAHFKLHNLTKEKEKEVRYFIFQQPNIVYDNIAIGGSDLEIDIQIENKEKLRELIKEIKDKFSLIIQDSEILHYLKEYKYVTFPV